MYSGLIGVFALGFALAVMRRSPPPTDANKEAEPAPA